MWGVGCKWSALCLSKAYRCSQSRSWTWEDQEKDGGNKKVCSANNETCLKPIALFPPVEFPKFPIFHHWWRCLIALVFRGTNCSSLMFFLLYGIQTYLSRACLYFPYRTFPCKFFQRISILFCVNNQSAYDIGSSLELFYINKFPMENIIFGVPNWYMIPNFVYLSIFFGPSKFRVMFLNSMYQISRWIAK